jgi:hypothetical protein
MRLTTVLAAAIVVSIVATGALALANPQTFLGSGNTLSTSASRLQTASSQTGPVEGSFPGSFYQAPQHDLFLSQGLWWTFENNGTDVNYRTSPDGLVWSEPVALLTSTFTTQYSFAAWVQGDTLHYAAAHIFGNSSTGPAPNFLYRYGTLEPNGNISWAVANTQVSTQNHIFVEAIASDNAGNVWVAGAVGNSTVSLEVYRNSGNDSQWELAKSVSGGYETGYSTLVPLQTGMALLYGGAPNTCCASSPVYVTTTTDGGATWSPTISPPSHDYYMTYSSAVAMGNTIYFLGPSLNSSGLSSFGLLFWTYTLGSNATSPETAIAASPVADTLSESNGVLVANYVWNGTVFERVSTDLGDHWSAPKVIAENELYATLMTSTYSGHFGVLWNGALWNGNEEVGHYAKFYSVSLS